MKVNFEFILGVGGCIVGLLGVGYAMGSKKKVNDICKKIDKSIDDISNDIDIDISDKIIDDAVDNAVAREVGKQVSNATQRIITNVKNDMHTQVKTAVDEEYKNIRGSVTDKISKEVSNMNMRTLSDEVVEKAKKAAMEKFDTDLNSILDKYTRDLDNVSKIYSSIANSMSRDNDKAITFRM